MGLFPRARFRPDFAPIMGFVGANRSGKSALAVDYVVNLALRKRAPLWSNITITAEGVESRRITGMHDFSHISSSIVLLDDITAVAPARESLSAPADLTMRLMSLGHRDCLVVFTTPTFSDVDISLRKVTQSVIAVRPLRRREVEGQLWERTYWSYAKTYNTIGEESVTIGKDTPRKSHGFFRLRDLRLDAYDTREEIEMLADHAVCPVCGLRKRREYCKGNHPTEEKPNITDNADSSLTPPPSDEENSRTFRIKPSPLPSLA